MKQFFLTASLVLIIMSGPLFAAAPENVFFRNISIREGLSQGTVTCILQDSAGFMWFGGDSRLNRFDGRSIKVFKHEPGNPASLDGNLLRALHEDRAGTLWILTGNGCLHRFDRKTETFERFLYKNEAGEPLKRGVHNSIFEDREGHLWLQGGPSERLFKFDTATGTFSTYESAAGVALKEPSIPSRCFYLDPSGFFWLSRKDGVLTRFDPRDGSIATYEFPYDPPKHRGINMVTALHTDRQGTIWAAFCEKGIYRFDPGAGTFTAFAQEDFNRLPSKHRHVVCIHEAGDGNIWMGTSSDGALLLDKKAERLYVFRPDPANPGSLGDDTVICIHEDRTGILWFGTARSGVYFYDPKQERFNLLRNKPGSPNTLTHDSITAIYEQPDGIYWLGTDNNGLDRWDRNNGTFRNFKADFTDPKTIVFNSIASICGGRDGTIWVATPMGLCALDPETETFTRFRALEGKTDRNFNIANSVLVDHAGTLWLTTLGGLAQIDRPKQEILPALPPESNICAGTCLFEDSRHNIWVGTFKKGLYRLGADRNQIQQYKVEPGKSNNISSNQITAVYEDRTGNIWIGTANGIDRLDPETGKFSHFSSHDGLVGDSVVGILEDDGGRLWLSTNRGISCFSPDKKTFRGYGMEDGLQGYEYHWSSIHKSSSGEMFFGGLNGLNFFRPERFRNNPHVPPVKITNFKLFNRDAGIGDKSPLKAHIPETEKLVLSYKDNTFSFQFAALDFSQPHRNRYKYKLEGLHRDWIDLMYKNDVSFTGLEPGEYTLVVRGSNNDGIFNEKGTWLKIKITPPFWETTWFRLLTVLLLLGLLMFWHKNRLAQLSKVMKKEAKMELLLDKFGVSAREREILQLVLKGKSNKEIEDALYISLNTVKSHIYSIYKKVNVQNRLELINVFQSQDIRPSV